MHRMCIQCLLIDNSGGCLWNRFLQHCEQELENCWLEASLRGEIWHYMSYLKTTISYNFVAHPSFMMTKNSLST